MGIFLFKTLKPEYLFSHDAVGSYQLRQQNYLFGFLKVSFAKYLISKISHRMYNLKSEP